jgi:hypothetical protein
MKNRRTLLGKFWMLLGIIMSLMWIHRYYNGIKNIIAPNYK